MIPTRRARVTAGLAMSLGLAAACADARAPAGPDDPGGGDTTGTAAVPALRLVAAGLDRPVFVTAPPGDASRLYIVEQPGRIRIVRNDTLLPGVFLDLSALVTCCGEQGLLGLAFDPAFATTRRFYVNYTDRAAGTTRVVRYRATSDPEVPDLTSAVEILAQAQPYSNHNGGHLAFGADGYLYVGLGDGGNGGDPQNYAQTLSSLLGKMLRLDVSGPGGYVVPPTNPFVGNASARPEIWATGLRNPWRYSFDRLTGALYIGDVGQGQVEEINAAAPGAGGRNYGWRRMEGSACYEPACSTAGLTLPVHEYSHADGCSVTGGYVYRGTRLSVLAGHYLYADYCAGWVRSFRLVNGVATGHADWPDLRPGGSISSFGEDARGELYVVAYGTSGSVYRIVPR